MLLFSRTLCKYEQFSAPVGGILSIRSLATVCSAVKPLLTWFRKRVVIFFKGVVFAQNAKEGVIGMKLLVVHFLCKIESFVGKETLCLFGLVRFEEKVKTGGTTEELHDVQYLNVSKHGRNKLIGFLYNCRFKISLTYKNW